MKLKTFSLVVMLLSVTYIIINIITFILRKNGILYMPVSQIDLIVDIYMPFVIGFVILAVSCRIYIKEVNSEQSDLRD